MNTFQCRQGDVYLERVAAPPTGQRTTRPRDAQGRIVLAYGEATGHSHSIADVEAELIEFADGSVFLLSESGGISLRHEEHAPVEIPAGNYRVTLQREYFPDEIRNVRD